MVTKRIITVLTFNDGVLFRTRDFVPDYRYTSNFVDTWSVDEMVLLDITRGGTSRQSFYEAVHGMCENCFVPLTVGGGVRTMADFKALLTHGGDKVSVNTGALADPGLIESAAKKYGSQCVVLSMDVKKSDGKYEVMSSFGREPTGKTPQQWAIEAQERGAGEILLQSIDLDGTLEGYDMELVESLGESLSVPLLVNCGGGNWGHFYELLSCDAVAAACTQNIYHFTETSIKSAKAFLSRKGVFVRE